MPNTSSDTPTLSQFKRNTAEYLAKLKESGHPLVLTVNGKAELVVQDAAAYERMRELAERADMQEFLARSRRDVEEGRTRPMREAVERLGRARE